MLLAVCDDDLDEIARISAILNAYRQERMAPILYKIFHNAADMLLDFQINNFSLYFLDIMMPEINGIEAAAKIRCFDDNSKIVFLTSSIDFAFQSYAVKAHDYIIKPASKEKIFPILDDLLNTQKNLKESISLKTRNGVTRIAFSDLSFIEVINKCVSFHMLDGQVRDIIAPLAEFESILLARKEFVRVHRSYIVNLWHVSDFGLSNLTTLSGKRIPISRRMYSKIRDAYVEQSFCKEVE